MPEKKSLKNITSLYPTCAQCGVPDINCICNDLRHYKSKAQFWILSTAKEIFRPSNTARLLKLINPESTEIFIWERKNPSKKLLQKIQCTDYAVSLIFPTDDSVSSKQYFPLKTNSNPAFIILDGTWKEARKIYRKSPYLWGLPTVHLETKSDSDYQLRRNTPSEGLCTIEAAIETLKLQNEAQMADGIQKGFELFQKNYLAGASGHRPL